MPIEGQLLAVHGRSGPGQYEAAVHLGDTLLHVGKLRFTHERTRWHSEFTCGQGWVEDRRGFALAPDLPLGAAPFFSSLGRSGNPERHAEQQQRVIEKMKAWPRYLQR